MAQHAKKSIKCKIQALKEELEMKRDENEYLKSKLKQINEKSELAETEAKASDNKYILMEGKLEQTEEKLQEAKKVLDEIEADRDEKERELRKYINSEETTACTLEQQISELKEVKDIAQQADFKYEEISRKLVVVTTELDLAEKRAEEADLRAREATRMAQLTIRCLNSQKQSMEKLNDDEFASQEKIALLQSKLDQTETAYEEKVKEVEKLTADIDKLEDDLFDSRLKCQELLARCST